MEFKRLVGLFIILGSLQLIASTFTCGPGQQLSVDEDGKESCIACQYEQYMAENEHRNLQCNTCSRPDWWRHEVEEQACTKTSNTVIVCKDDHYRASGECNPCTKCGVGDAVDLPYTARQCGKYDDCVCSEKPTHDYGNGITEYTDGAGEPIVLTTPATTTTETSTAPVVLTRSTKTPSASIVLTTTATTSTKSSASGKARNGRTVSLTVLLCLFLICLY